MGLVVPVSPPPEGSVSCARQVDKQAASKPANKHSHRSQGQQRIPDKRHGELCPHEATTDPTAEGPGPDSSQCGGCSAEYQRPRSCDLETSDDEVQPAA